MIEPNEHAKPTGAWLTKIAIAILVALAIALVLFPDLIFTPQPDTPIVTEVVKADNIDESNTNSTQTNTEVASVKPVEVVPQTPFADAVTQQARKDSQALLAQLLENIQQLEALKVNEWNSEGLISIQELAQVGDDEYAQTQYEDAIATYQQALDKSQQLLDSRTTVADQLFNQGQVELNNNSAEQAKNLLVLAQLLAPDAKHISNLLARAEVRTEVFALDLLAENQLRKDDLDAALASYLSMVKLDPDYGDVKAKIDNIKNEILERDFAQAMSQGFSSLAQGKVEEAEQAFANAEKIKPDSVAVSDAKDQVEAAKLTRLKQDKIDIAVAFEQAEQWQQALDIYTDLLRQDNSLVSAKLGQIRTQARAALNKRVQEVLDNPLSLQSEKKWQAANTVLTDARDIIDRGPVLTEQITALETVITRARTRITLALSSDNNTQVEIYRLSKLGKFKQHAVALYPGKYVVVGSRAGYRDVREDLVIDGFSAEVQLNIACTESI